MLQLRDDKKNNAGFTLIELMITVAIVALLASIAIPSYSSYVMRGKRAEGRAKLLDVAALEERYYSDCNRYGTLGTAKDCTAGTTNISTTSETGLYNITIALSTPFQSYSLTATPTFTDSDCGNLTLTHDGTKGNSGSSSVNDCWGK